MPYFYGFCGGFNLNQDVHFHVFPPTPIENRSFRVENFNNSQVEHPLLTWNIHPKFNKLFVGWVWLTVLLGQLSFSILKFQLGWVLKKFQVGRYKFQVGVGGKTWKCVFKSGGNRHKTHRNKGCVKGGKVERNVPMQNGLFQLRVEISTLVVLVTVFSISS